MEAPDEELMIAYRDGDAGAFETLYARHRGALYRFVLRSLKDRAVAEELFQEAWIRVIEARERIKAFPAVNDVTGDEGHDRREEG